jgi:site-specific recombinase XerD
MRSAAGIALTDWDDAVADFLLLVKGTREEKTVTFYSNRLSVLSSWAKGQEIPLSEFRARHLRQYLAARSESQVSDNTRRHDAVATKAFLKFCAREAYITSDPLIGYQVPKPDRAYVKCPSDDEIRILLTKIEER